jgi:hypothetical protein
MGHCKIFEYYEIATNLFALTTNQNKKELPKPLQIIPITDETRVRYNTISIYINALKNKHGKKSESPTEIQKKDKTSVKLKLLSIPDLSKATLETLLRFPLLSFFLLLGATNHLYMDIVKKESLKYYSQNLFMAIVLLVPVLYSLQLCLESNWIKKNQKILLEGLVVLFAGVYLYFLPNSELLTYHLSQFWLFLSIAMLLCLVCIKDCLKNDELFWHFHISLFSRLTITALYTAVILGGTSAALGAIDALFKTKLLEHQDIRIVIVTLWIFMPLFFLTGVPKITDIENILKYKPQWIKNISIYVLIPFTTIYLAILYAYMGKIVFLWKLPDGMVSYLVLSFAAFGITSLIIVFPFQKDENSRWTYWFGRFFYFLQFPLLILLAIAIYQRVMDYGITFRRFYVLVLALWLLFITIFMVVRKNRNLIAIPITLLLLAFFSAFGPWSAFNVSFVNQKSRLDTILKENGLIVSGKLKKPATEIPGKIKGEICSITKYLFDYGKLNVYSETSSQKDTLTPEVFVKQLGFEYHSNWGTDDENNRFFAYSFVNDNNNTFGITIDTFNVFLKMDIESRDKDKKYKIHMNEIDAEYNQEKQTFYFKTSNDSTAISVNDVLNEFSKKAKIIQVEPYIHQSDKFKIVCLFNTLSGNRKLEENIVNTIDVDFLIKIKN